MRGVVVVGHVYELPWNATHGYATYILYYTLLTNEYVNFYRMYTACRVSYAKLHGMCRSSVRVGKLLECCVAYYVKVSELVGRQTWQAGWVG